MMRSLLLALTLGGALAVPVHGQVRPENAGRLALSAEAGRRLMADLRWLADDARNGRRAGSHDNELVQDWIMGRFADYGLDGRLQPFALRGDRGAGANVIAEIPGEGDHDGVIVVTAHFDHLGARNGRVFNGADDNASGTAALFALADHLVASPTAHTVLLVALDAEEAGLQGARHFVSSPPAGADRIRLNVNLDMIGRSDTATLYAAGAHHYPDLEEPLSSVAGRAPITLRLGHDSPSSGSDDWTFQSDHGAFHRAGIPFVYFGVEDHVDYHRPTDDADAIDAAFYVGAVETVLMAVEALDRHLSGSSP